MTAQECEADLQRKRRAYQDCALVSRQGDMERRIAFEVGFDHRGMGCDHGCHGMQLRFVLLGPAGAVQWLVYLTDWLPGNLTVLDEIPGSARTSAVFPADLGYHARESQYEGHFTVENCEYLNGPCFYDGSGLNAGPVLAAFVKDGPSAVWDALNEYYSQLFTAKQATA